MAATRVPESSVNGSRAVAAVATGDRVRRAWSAVDEARLGAVLEIASDGLVVADRDGTIVLVNELAEQMFGYARDELLGESVEVLVPARVRAAHVLHRLSYIEDGLGQRLEMGATRRDGEEFPAEITLSALGVEDDVLVVASVRDVTERRRAEEQSARLAAVVRSSHEAIIAKTLEGIITDWNPAAERMYGYPAHEVIGTSISVLLAC